MGTLQRPRPKSRGPKLDLNRETKSHSDWKFGGSAESDAPFAISSLALLEHDQSTSGIADSWYIGQHVTKNR